MTAAAVCRRRDSTGVRGRRMGPGSRSPTRPPRRAEMNDVSSVGAASRRYVLPCLGRLPRSHSLGRTVSVRSDQMSAAPPPEGPQDLRERCPSPPSHR